MTSPIKTLVLAALAFVGTISSPAQEPPQPGPEHAMLKKLEGTWVGKAQTGEGGSSMTMVSKMELGGLWLVSTIEGDFGGVKFQGRGMDTYDADKKKYVSVWADSMSTKPMISEGSYDKAKKTLTMVGEGLGPDGKMAKYKTISQFPEEDRQKVTVYLLTAGGEEIEIISLDYTRKK